jgi:hypothetical protein
MDDDAAYEAIVLAFGSTPRPGRFVDASHCEECAEHEATLQAATSDSLSFATFGKPGWDPVTYLQCDGLAYFMPGLVRLALYRGSNRDYTEQFCAHMQAERMSCFTAPQRAAMTHFLRYYRETRAADLRNHIDARTLLSGLDACIAGLAV